MADAPHLEADAPACINGYHRRHRIGHGRYADVFLVTRNNQNFARKELQHSQPTNEDEIAILSSLVHRNVVSYQESFTEEFTTYIVMEYCKVGNLMRVLRLQQPTGVDERFVAIVMTMLCCGMEYIHGMHVIHRDIKPDNIFIKEDGVVKIGDFGGSAYLEPDTLTTGRFGTDVYMSPECKQGQHYGFPSDMWSIGQVLHDLCFLGQLMDSDVLEPLKDRLKSREPSSRPTAAEAHLLFCEIEQNLRQGNPVGAFAGNNGAAIIDFLERNGLLIDQDDNDDDDDDDENRVEVRAFRR